MTSIPKLSSRLRQRHSINFAAIVAAVVFGVLGSISLLATHAATSTASIETESGAPTGSAIVVNDNTASNNAATKFGNSEPADCPDGQLGFVPNCVPDNGSTTTTPSGVVTHGAIVSTDDTIGWLLTCQPSHELADDPIVFPGQPGAAHLHDFWGNASTNGNSTLDGQESDANLAVADTWNGATATPGTSCNLSQYDPGTNGDTASYWAPVLYANGQKIQPGTKAQLYYRAKPTFGIDFQPFPQDARIIVGSHAATSLATNPALVDGHIYWECQGVTSVHYQLPPTTCTGLLVNIVFPSCYDNGTMNHTGPKNTDNQHFAYAINGVCPSGFPQKVPQLSEKFKYTVPATGMNLQLSADPMPNMPSMTGGLMPTYTMHADFWNTWRPASLQFLVDKCINAKLSCGTNPLVPVN